MSKEPLCTCLHCGEKYVMTQDYRIAHTCPACFEAKHWIIVGKRQECPVCREQAQKESDHA